MTLVCAHRGASAYHPDNSVAAFEAAIDLGADMIEADVRRTPDGRLVLAHDPLRAIEAVGAHVALDRLIELTRGRIRLHLELKEAGYEKAVLNRLWPRPRGLVMTSFLPDVVRALRGHDPSLRLGLVIDEGDDAGDPLERAAACGATFAALHWTLVDERLAARAEAAGAPLVVWTVNDDALLARYLAMPGVGTVITDRPDAAVALRG